MNYLTGGTVTYNRRMKTGDYEHADVKVELNFSFPDDDCDREALLAMAGRLAHKQCWDLLNAKSVIQAPAARPIAAPAPAAPAARAPEPAAAPASPPDEPPKRGPGRPVGTGKKRLVPGSQPPPAADPLDMGELDAAPEADPLDMDELDAPTVAEITDKELTEALAKKNAELKDALAIRKLIGKYVQAPNRAASMAQEMRPKFMAELAALKPLA